MLIFNSVVLSLPSCDSNTPFSFYACYHLKLSPELECSWKLRACKELSPKPLFLQHRGAGRFAGEAWGEHRGHADGQLFQSAKATGKAAGGGRSSLLIASLLLRRLSRYYLAIAAGAGYNVESEVCFIPKC